MSEKPEVEVSSEVPNLNESIPPNLDGEKVDEKLDSKPEEKPVTENIPVPLESKIQSYEREIEELRAKLALLEKEKNATQASKEPEKSVEETKTLSLEVPLDENAEQKKEGQEISISPPRSVSTQENQEFRKELDAGDFLFRRANSLHDDGWYERAQPLYDEGCIIYEKLYGSENKETLECFRKRAINLWRCSKVQQSYFLFKQCLQTLEKSHGDQSEEYIAFEIDFLYLLLDMGQYEIVTDRVEFIISHLTSRIDSMTALNMNKKYDEVIKRCSIVLGRALCIQTSIFVHEGKLNEAKVVSERAQAVISQSAGLNSLQIIEAFQTKAKVLLALAKPKESISLMEQSIMVLRGVLKPVTLPVTSGVKTVNQQNTLTNKNAGNSPAGGKKSKQQAAGEENSSEKKEIEHPIIAECLVIHARAAIVQCSFLEAQNKLKKARSIRLKFFPVNDLRLLEVDYYDANIYMALSDYQQALSIHETVLMHTEKHVENMFSPLNEISSPALPAVESPGKQLSSSKLAKTPTSTKHGSSLKKTDSNSNNNAGTSSISQIMYNTIEQIDIKLHPIIANSYFAIAVIYFKLGNLIVAKEFFNKTILHLQNNNSPNHLLCYESKIYLLNIMQQQGQYDESYPYIEDALEKLRKVIHKEHVLYIQLLLLQAQCFLHRKEYSEVETILSKSLKVMKLNFSTGHALVPYIILDLIWCYIRQENYAEAFKYYEDCKTATQMTFGAFLNHELYLFLESIDQVFTVYDYREKLNNHDLMSLTSGKVSLDNSLRSITGEAQRAAAAAAALAAEQAEAAKDAAIEAQILAQEQTNNGPTSPVPKAIVGSSTAVEETTDDDHLDPDVLVSNPQDDESLPSYTNEIFMHLIQNIDFLMERFHKLYNITPGAVSLQIASAVQTPAPSAESTVVPPSITPQDQPKITIPGSMLYVYMKGLLGEAKLMEFVSSQQYIQSLSSEQREVYYATQAEKTAQKLSSTTNNESSSKKGEPEKLEPPGKVEMETAIEILKNLLILKENNYFFNDLEKEFRSLELQFDELEIAKYQLSKAKELKRVGKFLECEKFFDEAFVLFFHCLGGKNAFKSTIIAEILFEKAENARNLSKNVDYIKNLHLLAIRVYRQATTPKPGTGSSHQTPSIKELNNHEFIWRNLFAMSQLLIDQQFYDEVLPMHKSLHDIIITSSAIGEAEEGGGDNGEEAGGLIEKKFPLLIQQMFDRQDFLRLQFLIKAKISIANDLLHLYRYEEALKYDAEALDLLKKLSIASATATAVTTATTPAATKKKSVDFSQTVTPNIPAAVDQNNILAEYLIRIYLNEIQIHDYLGEFSLSQEYYEQIEVVLDSWMKSEEATHFGSNLPSIPSPSKPSSASSPTKSNKKKKSNEENTENTSSTMAFPKSAAIQTMQSEMYFIRSQHLMIINRCNESNEFLQKSFQIRLNLYNLVREAPPKNKINPSTSSRKASTTINAKKEQEKPPTGPKAIKNNPVDFEWTPQKEEEIKMKFLSAIEILISSEFLKEHQHNQKKLQQMKQNIKQHHRSDEVVIRTHQDHEKDKDKEEGETATNTEPDPEEEEEQGGGGGGGVGDDQTSLDDIESMLLSVHDIRKEFQQNRNGGAGSASITTATTSTAPSSDEFTIQSFIPKEVHVHEFHHYNKHVKPSDDEDEQEQEGGNKKKKLGKDPHTIKLTSSLFFIEIFFQMVKLTQLLGQLTIAKDTLDLVMTMFYDLFPQYKASTNNSLYKLSFLFAFAKYKLLVNQIEESKNLHLKILENRLSLIVHGLEYSLDIAESYQCLGEIYLLLGQMDMAMQYINDALKIERKCFSLVASSALQSRLTNGGGGTTTNIHIPSHLLTKDSHYRIQMLFISCAEILTFKCFYGDANTLCDSILIQLKYFFAPYHELHSSIAYLYTLKGRNELGLSKFDNSLNYFQQSKNIISIVFNENHYYLGILYYYYSQVMRCLGKLLETKQYLDLAIKSVRTNLGKYHYWTILIIYEIGLNFMDLGKYNTSDHILQRALFLMKKLIGKDHLIIASFLNSMGELYLKMGFLDRVNEPLENALFICRKVMGTDRFPLIPVILGNMNELKCVKGIYDLATQGIESCLSMMKLIFTTPNVIGSQQHNKGSDSLAASNHYTILKLLFIYANILFVQGRYYDAFIQYDRIYHQMKVLYPQDHPILYEAQYGIANCYLVLGRLDHAKALYERCLQALKDWKGSIHPFIGNILNKLGDVYNSYCKFLLAENLLKEAWTIRMKTLKDCNENHPDIVENLLSIAENLRLRGLYDVTISANKEESQRKKRAAANAAATAAANGGGGGDDVVENKTEGDKKPKEDESKKFGQTIDPFEIINNAENKGNGEGEEEGKNVAGGKLGILDDEETIPTIAISQIENMEGDEDRSKATNDSDPNALARLDPNDPNRLFMDTKNYKAMPILIKCSGHLLTYLEQDTNHPFYLKTRFLEAEIIKGLGKYDKSLELHETLFQQRRKILPETHLDTIQSLIAIADLLRIMKKVFSNSGTQKIHHSMASDSKNMIGSGPKMTGNVTLVEHLTAIALPMKFSKESRNKKNKKSSNDEFYDYSQQEEGGGNNYDDEEIDSDEVDGLLARINQKKTLELIQNQQWKFISKPDDSVDAKDREKDKERAKKVLLRKGYMGYAFPPVKKESETMNMDTIFGGTGGNGGGGGGEGGEGTAGENNGNGNGGAGGNGNGNNQKNGSNADAKKCLDLAISLIRKLFKHKDNEEEGGTPTNADTKNAPTNALFTSMDHPFLALCLYIKAEIARIKGDGVMALKLLEQSLGMRRRIFRSHHPLIADCLYSMAELLRTDQRYLQALPIYDKALEIRIETYGSHHPAIAEIQNSIALLYMSLGNFTKAKELLTEALSICEIILGMKHPSTALIYNNQAGLLLSMGNYQEAINWNKKTLIIKQQLYSENHPEIAYTLNNLGLLYKATKNYEKALIYFEKALEIQKSFFTNHHPEIATTMNNIGALMSLMDGKKFEAKEYFKNSLNIRMICFGNENALVASTMNNYAGLLYQLNEFSQCKELFEEALNIRRKIFQDDHPAIAESFHNLGYFYFQQKYYLDARYYYEEAYKIRKKVYPEDHHHLCNTMNHLFFVYDALKLYDLAFDIGEKLFQIKYQKYQLQANHPEVVAIKELLDYLEKKIIFQKNSMNKAIKANNLMNVSNTSIISSSPNTKATGGGTNNTTGSTSSNFVKKKKNEIARSQQSSIASNNNNNDNGDGNEQGQGQGQGQGQQGEEEDGAVEEFPESPSNRFKIGQSFESSPENMTNLALGERAMEI